MPRPKKVEKEVAKAVAVEIEEGIAEEAIESSEAIELGELEELYALLQEKGIKRVGELEARISHLKSIVQ